MKNGKEQNHIGLEFKIEKNIPVPERRGKWSDLPEMIKTMKKGDSFAFDVRYRNPIAAIARGLRQEQKIDFVIRKVGETELRYWRLS